MTSCQAPSGASAIIAILMTALLHLAHAEAQQTGICAHIRQGGTITIVQPETLEQMLSAPAAAVNAAAETANADVYGRQPQHNAGTQQRSGYRVQIFDDNNPRTARREAESRQAMVHGMFPEMKTYVTFDSPYWRVKVGDYRTRAEAEAAMDALRHAMPSMAAYMRIVRDKINIQH